MPRKVKHIYHFSNADETSSSFFAALIPRQFRLDFQAIDCELS